ncbi:MAG: low molecular weight phosphotyrosine protein phosphatase [Bacteroidetes bacterium]|nr:MAG: low molecular weight phosphotyrosine protein phosphatase [Bacteroidota bacterium]
MKKILMVCLGNICRSPMAEGIVRDEFAKHGINIQVDSAGTAAYHVGERADERGQAELAKHGIDISDERAMKLSPYHLEEYDMIYAMDRANYSDILMLTKDDKERAKVDLFMNLSNPGKNISVPDPYYGGDEGFTKVYDMLKESAEALVEKIKSK